MTSPSGPSRHDLGDADLVVGRRARRRSIARRRPRATARRSTRGSGSGPRRTSPVVCRIVPPARRRARRAPHAARSRSGCSPCWSADGSTGARCPATGVVGRRSALVLGRARRGSASRCSTSPSGTCRRAPTRSSSRRQALWAEHTATRRWSSGRSPTRRTPPPSTTPTTRSGGPTAIPTPWRSTSSGTPPRHRRRSNRRLAAPARVRLRAGRRRARPRSSWPAARSTSPRSRPGAGTAGWPARRAVGLGPLALPAAVAHTGLRAPFAFPDGTVADLGAHSGRLAPTIPRSATGRPDRQAVRRRYATADGRAGGQTRSGTCSMASSPNSVPSSMRVVARAREPPRTRSSRATASSPTRMRHRSSRHTLQDHRGRLRPPTSERCRGTSLTASIERSLVVELRSARRGASSSARSRCRCGRASRPTP